KPVRPGVSLAVSLDPPSWRPDPSAAALMGQVATVSGSPAVASRGSSSWRLRVPAHRTRSDVEGCRPSGPYGLQGLFRQAQVTQCLAPVTVVHDGHSETGAPCDHCGGRLGDVRSTLPATSYRRLPPERLLAEVEARLGL